MCHSTKNNNKKKKQTTKTKVKKKKSNFSKYRQIIKIKGISENIPSEAVSIVSVGGRAEYIFRHPTFF